MMARKMMDIDTEEELVETSSPPADADLKGRVRTVFESVDLTLLAV